MASSDLAREVPQGSIHFRARLASSMQTEEIRRTLGLPVIANGRRGGACLASSDRPGGMGAGEWAASRHVARRSRTPGDSRRRPASSSPRAISRRACPPDHFSCESVCGLRSLRQTSIVGSGCRFLRHSPQPPSGAIASQAAGSLSERSSTGIGAARHRGHGCSRTCAGTGQDGFAADQRRAARPADDVDRRTDADSKPIACWRSNRMTVQLRPIVQRLDAVTSALQETVLRTRMQPIGNLFGKFPQGGSRPRKAARQTGRDDDRRPGRRTRQDDPRAAVGSAHSPGPQQRRPRHRDSRGASRERQARRPGRSPSRPHTKMARFASRFATMGGASIPRPSATKALAMRLKTESELDRMSPRELMSLDPASRFLDRPARSPRCPAAASAWTWSRRTSSFSKGRW